MKPLGYSCAVLLVSGCATVWVGTPAVVNVERKTLTDKSGMALYTFKQDTDGKSACYGPCLQKWRPLSASKFDKSNKDWATIVRDDGTSQWSYKGQPLYYWAGDHQPGDHGGDGIDGAWAVATP